MGPWLMAAAMYQLCFMLSGCGPALVPASYKGDPLLSIEGVVVAFEFSVGSNNSDLTARLFWTKNHETTMDPALLEEHEYVSVSVDFPAIFRINVFGEPPQIMPSPAPPYRVGQILIYEDEDENYRMTTNELRGGAIFHAILYTERYLDAETSPTSRPLSPGFHILSLPLPCDLAIPTVGMDPSNCGVPLGAKCEVDEDCGSIGHCLNASVTPQFGSGSCVLSQEATRCTPADGKVASVFFYNGTVDNYWVQTCVTDADCREDEECMLLDGGVCMIRHPVPLDVGEAYDVSSLCVDKPEKDWYSE